MRAVPGVTNTSPMLPPAAMAFRPLIAIIPMQIERLGPLGAARYCRGKIDGLKFEIASALAGDVAMLAALSERGVTLGDLDELLIWIEARAAQLVRSVS